MSKLLKVALAATTMSLGLVAGQTLAAEPVTITSAGVYAPATINVSGYGNEWAGAIDLSTLVGSAQTPKTLYVFCVDLSHEIYVNQPGSTDLVTAHDNNQYPETLAYQTGALTTDSTGALSGTGMVLTNAQISKIADLAAKGGALINQDLAKQAAGQSFDGVALSDNLGAIQGAIWSIEYPTHTVTAYDGTVASEMANYIATANANYAGPKTAIYAVNGATQGFVVAAGVPEAGTWVLMLAGFGLLGVKIRRDRRLPAMRPARG